MNDDSETIELKVNIEKDGPILLSKKNIIAKTFSWIIEQSPMLEELQLNKLMEVINKSLTPIFDGLLKEYLGFKQFKTYKQLNEFLDLYIIKLPEVENLNLSKVEREKNIGVHDNTRAPFMATSRYFGPKPEHDFIDLDALRRNICQELWNSYDRT